MLKNKIIYTFLLGSVANFRSHYIVDEDGSRFLVCLIKMNSYKTSPEPTPPTKKNIIPEKKRNFNEKPLTMCKCGLFTRSQGLCNFCRGGW
jgi:hypothetical protein